MNSGTSSFSTSSSLLARLQEFDPTAWERLATLYTPMVYHWCRRAGLYDNDAADVCQEVFESVARTIHQFRHDRPGDSFRGWLWTITRNKIRDHFRSAGTQPIPMGGAGADDPLPQLSQPPAEVEDDSAEAISPIVRRGLARVQAEFEDRTWQAFLRVVVGSQRAADVGEELGMSVGAVYVAKSRVLRRLREELDGLL